MHTINRSYRVFNVNIGPMSHTESRLLTSFVTVEANANANPAVDADMPGVKIATNAVNPIIALDSKLKRADSHRFTAGCQINTCFSVGYVPPHNQ